MSASATASRGYVHLSSLYIDGYGPFEDSLISDFTEGLNLVLVENEQAATALRDFIWSVIFGFEDDAAESAGIKVLEAPNRRVSGGFLGFDSPDGPITVARYRRVEPDSNPEAGSGAANNDRSGLVTITGPAGSLDQIVGRIKPQIFRRLVQIDAREIAAFREVIRRQIAETFAERAREAAEAEAVLREAGGQIDVPTIEEIMDEMRIARGYQVARTDSLERSVKGVGRRLRGSRGRRARLKILDQVRPTWNTILELQRQMDDLPRLPYVADDPIGRLEEVTTARTDAQARLDAARTTEKTKTVELEGLRPSEEEVARHRDIHELASAREGHARQVGAIAEAEREFKSAETDLDSELAGIGADWSADRVREFATTVDPAEIGQKEGALQQTAEALDSSEQKNSAANDASTTAAAEVAATQIALDQLGDIPAEEEGDLAGRLGLLRTLKATALAIAGRKQVIADLQVKRSDARRLGSGVSRIVMQAQSIVSAGFLLIGLMIWGVAKITSDGPAQTTGLVMMGAGITGVIFAAMFLWLQRNPTFGRALLSRNTAAIEAQQPADSSGDKAAAAQEPGSSKLLITVASAPISIIRGIASLVRALAARGRRARSEEAEKSAWQIAEEKQTGVDKAATEESGAADSDGGDEKPSEPTAEKRSPFGIKEFLGRFIKVEKRTADREETATAESDEDSKPDAVSAEVADRDSEPNSGDADSEVDEEKASAARDEAEASIPEELRDAQKRNEAGKGRIGTLLARVLKFGDEPKEQSDEEILSEMSEEGIWSASGHKKRPFGIGLVSSLFASISRSRSSSQPVSADSKDDEDDEKIEAVATTPTESAEEESSGVTSESETEEEPDEEESAAEADASEETEEAEEVEEAEEKPEADAEAEETEEKAAESEDPEESPQESPVVAADADGLKEAEEPGEADSEVEEPESEAVTAEDESESDAADQEADETPVVEVAVEELVYEFGDPIEALDEVLETASRELEALTGEFEKLSVQYAQLTETGGSQIEDGRVPMTTELIEYATTETERQMTTIRMAAKIRLKLAGSEQRREECAKTAADAEEQLSEAATASEDARDRWVQWLTNAGLATDLDPNGVRKISEALEPVRLRISAVEILQEKLEDLQARSDELVARVRQVAGIAEHDELAMAFDAIETAARAATALEEKLTGLEEALRALAERTSEAETEMSHADSLLQATLDELGADDDSHFRELTEGAAKRQRLADELDRMRIDTPLLTGVDSAGLDEELREISQELVEAELAELPGHIERLQSQLMTLEHDLTQAETELAGMPEMPDKEVEGGEAAGSEKHAMPALLRRPLGRSAMQAATRNLERLTAGKYRGLSTMASEDGGSIVGYKVVDANGNVDDPAESESASVFMALRLALIEDYYDDSSSVPAVILDVPALDDPEAAQAIVSSVMALSETVQVVCISADPATSGKFAAAAKGTQINQVDAISLDSPFRKVAGGN